MCAPNKKASKHMKQKLYRMRGDIDNLSTNRCEVISHYGFSLHFLYD